MSPAFNLLDEPWIKVKDLKGGSETVGLKGFFSRYTEFATFDGETPSQNVAIFRLLMAIFIQTVRQFDGWADLSERELWEAVYEDDELEDEIDAYLEEHRERFWLISNDAPFYQVGDLHTKKGIYKSAAELVPDVGPALFSTQTSDNASELPTALTARWLVHRQAYDFSGIKTGAEGDPRVKWGKGYPIGTGWVGNLGHTLLTGSNLKEMLLLNLPVASVFPDVATGASGDLAPWEREPDTAQPRTMDHNVPRGVVDVLTWQQRRIRLFASEDQRLITHVLIANGDQINERNCFVEPYSAQRYSKPQSKKGIDVYFARDLDPDLTIWRGVQAILISGGGAEEDKPAPIIEQLRGATGAAINERFAGKQVGLWLTGFKYGGANNAKSFFKEELSETLPVQLALLTQSGVRLRQSALEAIDIVFKLRGNLRWFYKGLETSLGGSSEHDFQAPLSAWIARLETEFTHWLSSLDIDYDPTQALNSWLVTVRSVTYQTVESAVEAAGPRAAIGVIHTDSNGVESLHNAARYELWIRSRIRDLTATEQPPTSESKE